MNDFIAVEYNLFIKSKDDENETLIEQRTEEQPFVFITNLNAVLPPFENVVANMNKGDKMDFYILPNEAFGEYQEDLIFDLPIDKFMDDNGFLNPEMYFVGNTIGLTDKEGHVFNARIINIKENVITVDLNHPKAGVTMHFVGKILERRNASQQEIQDALEVSRHCGGCGGCHGNCKDGCHGCG